jgi:4-amino-4-deoxy-L-arabinose transferase-like glycosyltransferase
MKHSNTNHSQHGLLMLLCCLIPIGLILAVSVFGLSLGPLNALLPYAIVLLCPLMMWLMMRGHGADEEHTHTAPQTPSIGEKK